MHSDDEAKYAELEEAIEHAMQKARAEGKEAELERAITQALEHVFEQGADALWAELKRTAPAMLAQHRQLRADFEKRLRERWGPALDLYEIILVIAHEAGDHFRAQHAQRAEQDRDLVFWVLVRLHARACQTASEVMALLSSGYATAAMSRWRTIHEVAVVMSLIKEHGQKLARCYLDHEAVEAAKGAKEYQKHHAQLGCDPFDPAVLTRIFARRDAVLKQYGSDFGSPYGWAAQALGIRKPTFDQLEQAAKLEHMRPYYRMASHGVHGNPKGILFQLEQIGPERVLLAGASNAGLADPGQATLIALLQCTVTFLTTEPDEFVVMILQAMSRLVDEAGELLLKIHQALVQDEEELQSRLSRQGDTDEPGDSHTT